jgi:hypothetical protein
MKKKRLIKGELFELLGIAPKDATKKRFQRPRAQNPEERIVAPKNKS